jgi:DNA-binding CsgD family transcriptional regulator
MTVEDRRPPSVEAVVNHNIPEEAMKEYAERFSSHDLWANAMKSHGLFNEAIISENIVQAEIYERSIIYNELSRKYDAGLHALLATFRFSTFDVIFGTHRRRLQGPFDYGQADLLRMVLPHLAHAMAGRQRVGESVLAARASQAVLDALDRGIVHIGRDGRIVHANRAAEAIFRRGDALRCIGSRLLAVRQADNDSLQHLITQAVASIPDRRVRTGGCVRVSMADGVAFYVVAAFPIEMSRASRSLREPAACLVIASSERRRKVAEEGLVSIFGLTPAEARVAARLAEGESLVDLARRLGIAHNTARSLLARVLHKTGTASQTALVTLIFNCLATL